MASHRATVDWSLEGNFTAKRYSRGHALSFDGGLVVPGTASPHIVAPAYCVDGAVDPEAAFTASLAACHMLWFLDFASREGLTVTHYRDEAEGTLAKAADGKLAMTRVVLRPEVGFAGEPPHPAVVEDLHHKAHEACFIANSVKTEVVVEPIV